MPRYDASPEWLRQYHLTGRDATRLFNALSALVDYEGVIKLVLAQRRHSEWDHSNMCDALRYLVDGE